MGRGLGVHGHQRAGVGGALHVRALLRRAARGVRLGARTDRLRLLAELARVRRLRAGGGLAPRSLGRAGGRDDWRPGSRRGPGSHRPGDIAGGVLPVLRGNRRRRDRLPPHPRDHDRDALVRAGARDRDGDPEHRGPGQRGTRLPAERVAHRYAGVAPSPQRFRMHRGASAQPERSGRSGARCAVADSGPRSS